MELQNAKKGLVTKLTPCYLVSGQPRVQIVKKKLYVNTFWNRILNELRVNLLSTSYYNVDQYIH